MSRPTTADAVSSRAATLAVWAGAWLRGDVAWDEVIDVVAGQQVIAVDDAQDTPAPASLGDVLVEWRRCAARPRLVLPVPGDVRGLPGPATFGADALAAGEAVHGGGWGLVPAVIDHAPSSAPPTPVWHLHRVTEPPPDPLGVGAAQQDLTDAIREVASLLTALDVAGSSSDVSTELARARRIGESLWLPASLDRRAVSLIAQSERMRVIAELARADPVGGAVDRTAMADREAALRPLLTAIRRGLLSGYNSLAEPVA